MHFTTLPLLFSAVPLALAQYGGYGGSDSSSTMSSAATQTGSSGPVHTVTVGADNNLAFSPNQITANAGDTVEFHFYGPKHSVAQSTFQSPCTPANANAFFSGPISTTGSGPNSNIWTLTVNSSTTAIWGYCAVPSHCESGMAFVINAP
jgi:plastocyanin